MWHKPQKTQILDLQNCGKLPWCPFSYVGVRGGGGGEGVKIEMSTTDISSERKICQN